MYLNDIYTVTADLAGMVAVVTAAVVVVVVTAAVEAAEVAAAIEIATNAPVATTANRVGSCSESC